MKMSLCVVTAERDGWEPCVQSWLQHASPDAVNGNWTAGDAEIYRNHNLSVVAAMQALYERCQSDILCYVHDDTKCYEDGWDQRVLKQFEDPKVGVCGFGGSLGHGDPEIYRKPYHISQLGRSFYMSNVDDAEVHGVRFTEVRDVATLDGFSLAVRRSLLDRLGGWPNPPGGFHCYDHAITLSAHRLGYRVRLVGIRCHHLGGQTSVSLNGADAKWHTEAHKWLFESYRDVLPVWVNQ